MKRYDSYKDSGVGWIGEIPSHWKVERLKNHISLVTETSNSSLKIGLENIESFTGKYISSDTKYEGNGIAVETGDLVYGKLRPYLCKAWIATFSCNAVGDFFVFRGKGSTVTIPYIHKLFLSPQITGICNASTYGARMPRVSSAFILNMPVLIPTSSEQQAIVDYLKDKTLKIDQYVSARERERELLSSLKQSEIANVVTKGLNPNVRMKDSGIPWIGMIPEHWEVRRWGNAFTENKDINTKLENTDAFQFNYGSLVKKKRAYKAEEDAETYSKYTVLKPNDIVINGLNLNYDFVSQRVAISAENGIITSAYISMHPRKNVNAQYFCFLFKTMDAKKLFHGMGTGIRLTLSFAELKKQYIPVPPIEEQQAIVDYIEAKLSKIESRMADLQAEIDYLKEFKQRLISDVVTGQICVAEPQKGEKQ